MKLLSVNEARSWWWGHMDDLNPKGIPFHPLIVTFLVHAYKFKKYPDPTKIPVPPPTGEGFKFEFGEFVVEEGYPIAVGLSIHSDGLNATCNSSTKHADAFLSDLLMRYKEVFQGIDYNEVIRRKTYTSKVFVSTEKSLQTINPKLKKLAVFLSETVGIQPTNNFEFGGLSFWTDQTKPSHNAPFIFERAVDSPFSENRYYSSGPLETDKHLELLNILESILS